MPGRGGKSHTSQAAESARPNPYRRREAIHNSILKMGDQIATLEVKEALTELQKQTVLRLSKMLESMCEEFKAYHYEIIDSLETEEGATQEQAMLDEHQQKTMEFVDRLAGLLAKPQTSISYHSCSNRSCSSVYKQPCRG